MAKQHCTASPRPMNIAKEVAAMERMTNDQLRAKFAAVCGEQPRSRNRDWLVRRIAWRMQANAEGGLSERARRRALELANDADLRVTPPRQRKPDTERTVTAARPSTDRLPTGTLWRQYKGRTVRVNVLTDGFEYDGERYKSLTAVAQAVTGKHWNGYHFFGLRRNGGAQ